MNSPMKPTILVIFGGMGDLTWRKLAPAFYNLLLGRQLPEQFAVIGLDIKEESQGEHALGLLPLRYHIHYGPWCVEQSTKQ